MLIESVTLADGAVFSATVSAGKDRELLVRVKYPNGTSRTAEIGAICTSMPSLHCADGRTVTIDVLGVSGSSPKNPDDYRVWYTCEYVHEPDPKGSLAARFTPFEREKNRRVLPVVPPLG